MRASKCGSSTMRPRTPANIATSIPSAHLANTIPTVAAAATNSSPSVSICRNNRARLAPIARRIAISLRRALARASSRFATLAQPINSTSPTTVITISSGLENLRRSSSRPLAAGTSTTRLKYFLVAKPLPPPIPSMYN